MIISRLCCCKLHLCHIGGRYGSFTALIYKLMHITAAAQARRKLEADEIKSEEPESEGGSGQMEPQAR